MSKKTKITACGAVVLRELDGASHVLVVHRPAYDDWSLPKGKGEVDELYPETAVREVVEETGVRPHLGLRLPSVHYEVSKGPKTVHYWRGSVAEETSHTPDDEVDKVEWWPTDEALRRLTYHDERQVLSAAIVAPPTTTLLLVRHGKAMDRKNWTGPDQLRRLSSRGRKQSEALVELLKAFGVARTITSQSVRCAETLEPYADAAGLALERTEILTEEWGNDHPKQVAEFMAKIRRELQVPTAVCGHRPVLPAMFTGLGIRPRSMVVGETIAFHFSDRDQLLATDIFKPTA